MKNLMTTAAVVAASLVLFATSSAYALNAVAAGGGSQQVYELNNGNSLGLIGIYNYGNAGATIDPIDIQDTVLAGGPIINLFFGPMINYNGQGQWAGNPANFTPFTAPTQIVSDNSGRLFDSVWVEWSGSSVLVLDAPNGTSTLQNTATLDGDPLPQAPEPAAVPEPVTSTMALLGLSALGLTASRRRRA